MDESGYRTADGQVINRYAGQSTRNNIEFTTPVGRIVSGHPMEEQTTDQEGRPLVYKTGAKAGQPRVTYYVGLAIPKTDPGFAELYQKINAAARQGFPNLFDPSGNCTSPKFAFKMTDGDSAVPNAKGIAPNSREGYPGNWVFHFSGSMNPKVFDKDTKPILDKNLVKKGDYARIYGDVVGNGMTQQPGVYLNCKYVQIVGYGEAIQSGPDAAQVFNSPVTLPVGASATPIYGNTTMPPVTGGGSIPHPGMAPMMPAMPPIPPAAGASPIPPAAGASPIPPAAGASPIPPAPDILNPDEHKFKLPANGQIYTRKNLIAAGYKPEVIETFERVND